MGNVYYNNNGVVVRASNIRDVEYVSQRMRESDRVEIMASHRHSPCAALSIALNDSILCLTVEDNGEPLAMFGCNGKSVVGASGTIWLLATDALKKRQLRFVRHTKYFVDLMLSYYPYLENWVDERNKASIAWLKMSGAVIEDAKPYGLNGEKFHHFYFRR